MPRLPRLDIPGAVQHVICRGIERREIFIDEKDYRHMLGLLSRFQTKEGVHIYAFVLMPNHAHLLVRPLNMPLSTFMRKLLTSYAIYFNKRHKRAGHLFQNRFKSFIVEEDKYFLELIRYIHLNPIRAGIVQDLSALSFYPYSGYSSLMGRVVHPFYEKDYVLSLFARTEAEARRRLVEFMRGGIEKGRRDDLTGGGLKRSLAAMSHKEKKKRQAYDERILGSGDFVESILCKLEKKDKEGKPLEELLEKVAAACGITTKELCSGSKKPAVTKARAVVVYLAQINYQVKPKEMASILGVGLSTIYEIIRTGRGKEESKEIELG